MKQLITLLLFLSSSLLFAQERIDGNFAFQTDAAKKYSIYVPSTYDANQAQTLMMGFHPLNTSRWDAESWCDTLIAFAETNHLLLVCPDGGADGRIDDPIDVAFTAALMDSVDNWYNVNADKIYAMGFSWGARMTYTYGLDNVDVFGGFIPIGAAINGTQQVTSSIQNAADKPYYLVHGNNDSPSVRFNPIKNALEDNGAIVNSILMSGVGHTIDFPNRNAILTDAFHWIDSVHTAQLPTDIEGVLLQEKTGLRSLLPNILQEGQTLEGVFEVNSPAKISIEVLNTSGQILQQQTLQFETGEQNFSIATDNLKAGIYFVRFEEEGKEEVVRVVIW
ncbi:MAG: T9SS type A sorting domain-containing protein [Chitinophagales bacterium]